MINKLLIVLGLVRRRKLSHVDVFLGCYTAILMVWSFTDVRFWMPVFPLLLSNALAHHRRPAFLSRGVAAQRPDWKVGYERFGGAAHAAP